MLDDLKRAGYGFDPQWFHAHHAFRFPLIGEIATRGIDPEEDVNELMDYAQKAIMEIADQNTVSGSVHLKELMEVILLKDLLGPIFLLIMGLSQIYTGFVLLMRQVNVGHGVTSISERRKT